MLPSPRSGLGPGDEVILPTFTIISCASAVLRAGAVPVVVDSDPVTWNMDISQVEARITARTRAIMVVHVYGLPVDMVPLVNLARKFGLKVIEDAAEAHGLMYRDTSRAVSGVVLERPCGSFGDLSTFSFYPNKHVTTGEGGMIVMDDPLLAERCQSLRNLCFQADRRFVHQDLGWNFRLTNLQAALGVAQLERLDAHVERKRAMGSRYRELLSDLPDVQLPLARTAYADNIYWVYGLVLGDSHSMDARAVMQVLADRKIGTRPFFWPMHEQPVFRRMGLFDGVSCPVAERLARRGFYVPSGLALSEREMQKVAENLAEVLG